MSTDYVTDYLRLAGTVIRYHAWPTIQTQTIGEHSWQVALIYEEIFGPLSLIVERYIRLHDVAELIVGDIPFPVKAQNLRLKREFDAVEEKALIRLKLTLPKLSKEDKLKIKICDLLEMMCFGMVERELGNMLAVPIIKRTRQAAMDMTDDGLTEHEYENVCAFTNRNMLRHEAVLNQEKE